MSGEMEQYYKENGRKVFLYLMTLCGDADTAEELTQETFYRAIKSLKKYKGESSVYTWLCSIARNAWLEELRKRTKHKGEEITNQTPPNPGYTEDQTGISSFYQEMKPNTQSVSPEAVQAEPDPEESVAEEQ